MMVFDVLCVGVLCVVYGVLMSFVGCCVCLQCVPFVVARCWLLFGVHCCCVLCVEDVRRFLLFVDDRVLVVVVAWCVW